MQSILTNSIAIAVINDHNKHMNSFECTCDYEIALGDAIAKLRNKLSAAGFDEDTISQVIESDHVAH